MATPSSPASGSMDLLTVVTHELGHVLGLDHEDAPTSGVMTEALGAGVRHLFENAPIPASYDHRNRNERFRVDLIDWHRDDYVPRKVSIDWSDKSDDGGDSNESKGPASFLRVKQAKAKAGRWMRSLFS